MARGCRNEVYEISRLCRAYFFMVLLRVFFLRNDFSKTVGPISLNLTGRFLGSKAPGVFFRFWIRLRALPSPKGEHCLIW